MAKLYRKYLCRSYFLTTYITTFSACILVKLSSGLREDFRFLFELSKFNLVHTSISSKTYLIICSTLMVVVVWHCILQFSSSFFEIRKQTWKINTSIYEPVHPYLIIIDMLFSTFNSSILLWLDLYLGG